MHLGLFRLTETSATPLNSVDLSFHSELRVACRVMQSACPLARCSDNAVLHAQLNAYVPCCVCTNSGSSHMLAKPDHLGSLFFMNSVWARLHMMLATDVA